MNKKEYKVYLLSDHWVSVRNSKRSQMGYKCEQCQSTKDLQVHHLHYNTIGRESLSDLQLLCDVCHKKAHSGKSKFKSIQSHHKSIKTLTKKLGRLHKKTRQGKTVDPKILKRTINRLEVRKALLKQALGL